jgi:hypothetical protein
MKFYKWFAANVFNLLGAFFIGIGLPIGTNILSIPDYAVFIPIGITLAGISYYYKFIHK